MLAASQVTPKGGAQGGRAGREGHAGRLSEGEVRRRQGLPTVQRSHRGFDREHRLARLQKEPPGANRTGTSSATALTLLVCEHHAVCPWSSTQKYAQMTRRGTAKTRTASCRISAHSKRGHGCGMAPRCQRRQSKTVRLDSRVCPDSPICNCATAIVYKGRVRSGRAAT